MGLAGACYSTAYRPVLQAQAGTGRASNDPLHAEAALQAAATADPYAGRPRLELAAIAFRAWQTQGDEQQRKRFEQELAQALRLEPNDSTVWQIAGDWYLEAF